MLRQNRSVFYSRQSLFHNVYLMMLCKRKQHSVPSQSVISYAKYFSAMELDNNATQDVVRRQYIQMVKKFHPDSGTKEASLEKFLVIDEAYKKLQEKFANDQIEEDNCIGEYGLYYDQKKKQSDVEEGYEHPDIRHTAPQHRQYLDNEGFGFGTPAQRQRQYGKFRAARAVENVYKHRMDRLASKYETRLATQQREMTKDQITKNAMDRLVEDMIKESMANGEFENLPGTGKPLPERVNYNPYMDFTSHKVNEILVEGGFAPEWIMLKKEVRDDMNKIRNLLKEKRIRLGPSPLSSKLLEQWKEIVEEIRERDVKVLNKTIDRYNLVVPMMNSQMFHFELDKEAKKILEMEFPVDAFVAGKPTKVEKDDSIFEVLRQSLRAFVQNRTPS